MKAGTLHAAAAWVAGVAPKKPTSPIFGGVHLDASGGELRLSATNYDMFVSTTIPDVDMRDPGQVVVSAHLLDAITATVRSADDVALRVTDRSVVVSCGRACWTLPVLSGEWPVFPEPGEPVGEIDTDVFAKVFARTAPMAATDTVVTSLNGVQLTFGPELVFAATDRYRFAVAEAPWAPRGTEWPDAVTVPADLLRAVRDAVGSTGGTLTVSVSDDIIAFATPTHAVTGRLIDVPFPQWGPLIPYPRDAVTTVVVAVGELKDALTQVCVSDQGAVVHVRLAASSEEITTCLAYDPNAATVLVSAHSMMGEPVAVVCSQRYLRDALVSVGSPMVALHFFAGGPTQPFLVTAADGNGELVNDEYRHVVVPVRPRAGVLESGV